MYTAQRHRWLATQLRTFLKVESKAHPAIQVLTPAAAMIIFIHIIKVGGFSKNENLRSTYLPAGDHGDHDCCSNWALYGWKERALGFQERPWSTSQLLMASFGAKKQNINFHEIH